MHGVQFDNTGDSLVQTLKRTKVGARCYKFFLRTLYMESVYSLIQRGDRQNRFCRTQTSVSNHYRERERQREREIFDARTLHKISVNFAVK